ncbi:MAG TPA: cache domain-containing protein [Gammaproteobacteria bacterium]
MNRLAFYPTQYDYEETRRLVALVDEAADLVATGGEAMFSELSLDGSRWRVGETYIFVLDLDGDMLVHPDPALKGRDVLDLKDVNGKSIIRGLIGAATRFTDKPHGWFHYEWPEPGALLPRWKSSYVRFVTAPSGKRYVVGSGMYNDRMERAFVVDAVTDAVGLIEKSWEAAFPLLRDPTGPFIAKEAYVFVIDMEGVVLVHPAFPNLEGSNLREVKDSQGKYLIREMLELLQSNESGWVDYMWPKPGESVSTQKSTFVSKAKLGDKWVVVGCGVYLADAPREAATVKKMTASEMTRLVHEGAAVFEKLGEKAYPEFRQRGSKWFCDDTYFFVWTMEGFRVFHAADPAGEGRNVSGLKDIVGRPIGCMILEIAASPAGEGWIHYMYPLPGGIFPTWKSTFVKRVNFPSGKPHIIGCGIYNMQMDKSFIEDMVNRAATLITEYGKEAFCQLRDKTGPFLFMDTYVFVESVDGTELVNPRFPSLEGRNLMDLKDLQGNAVIRNQHEIAMREGSAWLELTWYKPGSNTPARKLTYVKKVQNGEDTFIVGSGIYMD